jgi:hypothetical protein
MPPLVIDGVVHPDEYEVRVDSSAHAVEVHPSDGPVFIEVYYSFDGAALHFGIRKTVPELKLKGVSIWIDPDCNGCELGDLLIAVQPVDRLLAYGIFDSPGHATPVAGAPPEMARAGVEVKCKPDGDTEVRLDLARQYANGLSPNPLPPMMHLNVTVQAERPDGEMVVNFLKGAPIETFVIAFE